MKLIKNTLCLSAVALMGLAFVPPALAGNDTSAAHQHGTEASEHHSAVMGKGVVHSVDLENRKINVSHEPIPALKWPEMTMDLDVADGVDMDALKPEQNIHFHIALGEDKVYRITKIMTPEAGEQCEAGTDCPMHDDMKHGGDDGHGDHKH